MPGSAQVAISAAIAIHLAGESVRKSISCINLKVASRVPLVTSLVVAGARANLATGLGARLRELGAVPDRDSLSEGPLSPAEYANCQLPSPAPSTTLVIEALTLHGARARRL